ncbi:phenylacetaldehyde reductase-like [Silene latifolia]|uniref:phenylacetaldehyde reductase-like n=1 Tax=Silene latifolia TaxID=37657 RepID=UPI003D76F419
MVEGGGEGKKVCVTGANGYIASWIIKLLLDRGYIVHGTVRSLDDPSKTAHLLELDGAKDRLKFFEASLSEEGSFDAAIDGCIGVFHSASPVKIAAPNPEEEIIAPAVNGTLNVLASCVKNPTVKRVVFTSSIGACVFNDRPQTPEVVVDETWWSVPEFCKFSPLKWYLMSKTLAEQAAWKFVKENGIDMVTINPTICIGPLLQNTLSGSCTYIHALVNGSETYLNETFNWVHVKDVAEAHIRAFEIPSAHGRYLMGESIAHHSEIVEILRELYPDLKLPTKPSDDRPPAQLCKISQEKFESLGIKYTPLRDAVKDTVDCFKKKKFITDQKPELKL